MQLIWYGHSCFLIKTDEGRRILIDPFESSLGYNTDFPKCDLITISHSHFDHSFINKLNIDTKIISACGSFDFDFLHLKGINSYHDNYNGLKRGRNVIYIFKFNNISLAHLGDLGHIPEAAVLDELTSLDFMLVPVGGNFTLNGNDAANEAKTLAIDNMSNVSGLSNVQSMAIAKQLQSRSYLPTLPELTKCIKYLAPGKYWTSSVANNGKANIILQVKPDRIIKTDNPQDTAKVVAFITF